MKNKTKYLVAILLMLISFLLIGATNVSAKTITVENEEELINASKGIDSEINEIGKRYYFNKVSKFLCCK